MLQFLKDLFWGGRDEERRHETPADDKGRMLEMDEPMSAAGAQLAGEPDRSETEESLRRAARREGPAR